MIDTTGGADAAKASPVDGAAAPGNILANEQSYASAGNDEDDEYDEYGNKAVIGPGDDDDIDMEAPAQREFDLSD